MIKKILLRILEILGLVKKVESSTEDDNSTTDDVIVVEKETSTDSNITITKDEDSTDVTIKVQESDEDDPQFEYCVFDESTIELIKDALRPIVKKYYSGTGQNIYYEFMSGLVKRIKVYCTISEDSKLLSIRFSMSDTYNATEKFEEFINKYILSDFYAKIQDTKLGQIPLEINLENGILKVRLVKFLNDVTESEEE